MGVEASESAGTPPFGRLNRTLVVLVQLVAAGVILGTSYNVARFAEVLIRFRQVKVVPPVIPELLTEYHWVFVILAGAIAARCGWETYRRLDASRTLSVNLAGLLTLLIWWALHSSVLYATLAWAIRLSVPRDP